MTIDFASIPHIRGLLETKSARAILESKDLAQIGDFLVNFIYTTVRIACKGTSGSIHVWDSSLRDAMELAGLRDQLGKNTKPGRVADAAEAFIAYAYFHQVMSLADMVEYLAQRLTADDFTIPKMEKAACGTAFGDLLHRLSYLIDRLGLLDFVIN